MKKLFSILAMAMAMALPGDLAAQPMKRAEEFFDIGASRFIEGQSDKALQEVNQGLSMYPGDFYLEQLKKLIEEQQQQGGDQQDGEDGEQPSEGEQESGQQDPGDEGPQTEEDEGAGENEQEASSTGQEPREQEGQAGHEDSIQNMTPEEAAILLDAMREEEMADRNSMRIMIGKPVHVDKDW